MSIEHSLNGERLKKKLAFEYSNRIAVRNGASLNFNFDIGSKQKIVDIVVCLNYEEMVAIVWDNQYRREKGSRTHHFSWDQKYDRKKVLMGMIELGSKKFQTPNGLVNEKVLIMSFETLLANYDHLYSLLKWDESDKEIIEDVAFFPESFRGRRTVSRWNRDQEFRWKILNAFGKQCAVCRCAEEKILEAAHIKAVADGGSDDVRNGICLCANHHRMFDKKLIQIDLKKWNLSYVADSVKCMPWYDVYAENGGKLVERKKEK